MFDSRKYLEKNNNIVLLFLPSQLLVNTWNCVIINFKSAWTTLVEYQVVHDLPSHPGGVSRD